LYFKAKYQFCQERNCEENGKIYKKNKKSNFIEKTKKKGKNHSKPIKSSRIRMQSFGITQAARGPSEPIAQRSLMKDRGISERT